MARVHTTGRKNSKNGHSRQNSGLSFTKAVITVFECVFCKTRHYIDLTSADIANAHDEYEKIASGGCNKCYGKVVFKEHRHIGSSDYLNGRR